MQYEKSSNIQRGEAEGVKGAIAGFVCFHCPLVASAEAKSSATRKIKQQRIPEAAMQTSNRSYQESSYSCSPREHAA